MRIIDSHAHYNHGSFSGEFRFLTETGEGYAVEIGDRQQVLDRLLAEHILCSIEPGISLDSCEGILELCKLYPGQIVPAMGVHPTRTFRETWRDRKKLRKFAALPQVVAVGETGLDYHYPRKEQHRLCQKMWFRYQLRLACRVKKPVILHVRQADGDMLKILKHHPARRYGGVVHCFSGGPALVTQYLRLGYHIGIGGTLLQENERAERLAQAVAATPLERILVETDSPFILPACKGIAPGKVLRRTRNTSLILPNVVRRIAAIKGIPEEQAAEQIWQNTVRLFGIDNGSWTMDHCGVAGGDD